MAEKVIVGISGGDPAGIGLEIILKTFADSRMLEVCTPLLFASVPFFKKVKKELEISDLVYRQLGEGQSPDPTKLNIVNTGKADFDLVLGKGSILSGKNAFDALEAATKALATNNCDVLVTAPIDKNLIQSPQFNFMGHTEYLANYANVEDYLMIMAHNNFRLGVVTGHVPIQKVATLLSQELILKKIEVLNKSLQTDFNCFKPKIAVLGLNPHAGDGGLIGEEEQNVIIPAIEKAGNNGVLAFGPFAADGFFAGKQYTKFDAVLAMYHDQGLIPFKAISEGAGVNFTAGLPVVRTSPDHGTAFDIAGKNLAEFDSFRNAIYTAVDIFKTRKENRDLHKNKLKPQKKPRD